MREFLDPVNWSRETHCKYKQHRSIDWDPELNKKEKRGWASVMFLSVCPSIFTFPDYTMWPASSHSWDHKISPQRIIPSNYELKNKGGGNHTTRKRKQKPVLKMLWYYNTVTTKITNTIPSLSTLVWSVAQHADSTLSATINWLTRQFKSLFYQLRLTVLFTESKRIFNTASLKCRLSCTFSVPIYFSSHWVLRVPLWHTCNLHQAVTNKNKTPWHACFLHHHIRSSNWSF